MPKSDAELDPQFSNEQTDSEQDPSPKPETGIGDDPLSDVRQALIEEEQESSDKPKRGIFGLLGRLRRKKTEEPVSDPEVGAISLEDDESGSPGDEVISEMVDRADVESDAAANAVEPTDQEPELEPDEFEVEAEATDDKPDSQDPIVKSKEQDSLEHALEERLTSGLVKHPEPKTQPRKDAKKKKSEEPKIVEEASVGTGEVPDEEPETADAEPLLKLIDEGDSGEYLDIREVALEDYQEEDEDGTQPKSSPAFEFLNKYFSNITRSEKMIASGLFMLLIVFIVAMSAYSLATRRAAQAEADLLSGEVESGIIRPVLLELPGGWAFPLKVGQTEDGAWNPNPQDAEWLEGTELCRWVALPWSIQLEAVVRTLEPGNIVELNMSNYDVLEYKVESLQNVPVVELETINTRTACLLVILTELDSDTRWVLRAVPVP